LLLSETSNAHETELANTFPADQNETFHFLPSMRISQRSVTLSRDGKHNGSMQLSRTGSVSNSKFNRLHRPKSKATITNFLCISKMFTLLQRKLDLFEAALLLSTIPPLATNY